MIKWIRPESKGALTPPHKRAVVLPDGSRALSKGDGSVSSHSAGSTRSWKPQRDRLRLACGTLDGSQLQCFMAAKWGLSPSLSKCVLFRGKTP